MAIYQGRKKERAGGPPFSVGAAACCSYYQHVISIEVRPFSRTIDTNVGVVGQGVEHRRAEGDREGERGF